MHSSSINGLSVFSDIGKTAEIESTTNKVELTHIDYNLLCKIKRNDYKRPIIDSN